MSATAKDELAGLCEAFEILFSLLTHIDECLDDVIFFADEGGSWQVGVDWATVLPAWFTCLAATAGPEEYAGRVVDIVDRFKRGDRDKQLTLATSQASEEQRKALEERTQWKR